MSPDILTDGMDVTLTGTLTRVEHLIAHATGRPWAQAVLADTAHGALPLYVFPRVWDALGAEVVDGDRVVVTGRIDGRGDILRVVATALTPASEVRALTVRQPWAEAIVWQGKRIENRTWKTHHRGPLLIHAGAGYDRWATIYGLAHDVRSAIVGVAEVTNCHFADWGATCCGPWGEEHVWHWVLGAVRRLPTPVPHTPGRLGLWTPPQPVLDAVTAALPKAVA